MKPVLMQQLDKKMVKEATQTDAQGKFSLRVDITTCSILISLN
jgi:hypothetical protein